jgi:hypothetical protein
MKKDLAALIVDAVVSLDKDLGTLSTLINRIDDEEERKRYAKALGDVMGLLMFDFLLPIEKVYPDLNPDK